MAITVGAGRRRLRRAGAVGSCLASPSAPLPLRRRAAQSLAGIPEVTMFPR
eukprot:NODE_8773_length_368_cov_190.753994.p4 GENE.NODE_8773_length_368_cov_190.753994~~NODE_8773_length_368_cov_190.753994.p4  ORF type:complete len:51 (-),score=5.56 NODE_8773_length_368_cov_190.753994:93-245(-)